MTIQLLHKVVIRNQDDAKRYQLELLYTDYFKQLNLQLDFLGIRDGASVPMPMQLEATTNLHNTYVRQFTAVLEQANPFVDLNDQPINIESIQLVCKTFIRNAVDPVLFILLQSKPMEVVDSYGSTKVLKNPSTIDGNPVLTVELDNKFTFIATVKE